MISPLQRVAGIGLLGFAVCRAWKLYLVYGHAIETLPVKYWCSPGEDIGLILVAMAGGLWLLLQTTRDPL